MAELLEFETSTTSSHARQKFASQNIWATTSLVRPNEDSKFLKILHSNDSSHIGHDLRANLEKLDSLKNLEANWNGNNAEPFSEFLIEKAKSILLTLKELPEVFPTAQKSIQFEYEMENGDYLEIEIFEDFAKFFQIVGDIESSGELDVSKIFSKVSEFYGEGFYQG
jgi:hypothetical protein